MKYGVIWPKRLRNDWTPEAERLVGKVIDSSRIIFNSLGDDDHVIIGPEPTDPRDEVYGTDVDIYLNGTSVPAECIVSIKDCTCATTTLTKAGCTCGGFKSEKEYRIKLRDSRDNLKRP